MFNLGSQTQGAPSYFPNAGDVIGIENANGGFIGGVKGQGQKLQIVDHIQDWEHFILEPKGDKFTLKQKVSGLYLGGGQHNKEHLLLSSQPLGNEIFQYNVLPNGFVNIVNHVGSKLGRSNRAVEWTNQNTINESWKFKLVQAGNPTSSTSATHNTSVAHSAGAIPPAGTVVSLRHSSGGYIGGVRNAGNELESREKNQEWEQFIIGQKNQKTFFQQKVSNLYIGHNDLLGAHVKLANNPDANELFLVESRGNGQVSIQNKNGLYLSKNGNRFSWSNGQSPNELWRIEVVTGQNIPSTQSTHNTQSQPVNPLAAFGLMPVAGGFYGIGNFEGGWIGGKKGASEDLLLSKKLQDWEHFEFVPHGNGTFSLKQKVSGNFIGLRSREGEKAGLADKSLANEAFTLENKGNGVFAIKNRDGLCLSHDGDRVNFGHFAGNGQLWRFDPVGNNTAQQPHPVQQAHFAGQNTNTNNPWGQQQNQGGWGQPTQGWNQQNPNTNNPWSQQNQQNQQIPDVLKKLQQGNPFDQFQGGFQGGFKQ